MTDEAPASSSSGTGRQVAATGAIAAVALAAAFAAGALFHSDLLTQATLQNVPLILHSWPEILLCLTSIAGGVAHCVRTKLHLKGKP